MLKFIIELSMVDFLERLKLKKIVSIHNLNGDEVYIAEKLVDMKLASKCSTRINTFYFYGIPNGEKFCESTRDQ